MKNLIAILLVLFATNVKAESKYKLVAYRKYSEVYLIENSVKNVDYGLYHQAWFKEVPIEGKEEQFRNAEIDNRKKNGLSIKGFQDYAYSMVLIKSDCDNNKMATMESIYYSIKGDIIYTLTAPYTRWSNVVPSSMGEGLNDAICKAAKD